MSSFLRTDNPQNVRAMILMHNSEVMSRPWYEQLKRGVREGAAVLALALTLSGGRRNRAIPAATSNKDVYLLSAILHGLTTAPRLVYFAT